MALMNFNSAPPAPDGDIEHPVVLPAQPREHTRVLRGTVRRVTRPWAGLALTNEKLEGLEAGCAEGDHAECRQNDSDCIYPYHSYEEP